MGLTKDQWTEFHSERWKEWTTGTTMVCWMECKWKALLLEPMKEDKKEQR